MTARVLIVDDIPANLRLLEAKLTAEYFAVQSAQSGPEALEKAAADPPDIVLLDVMMPEMDGFEVCHRLKTNPRTAPIPVVMVTALSDTEDRVRGLEAGADDFLTKPVNDLTLFARVRSLVRLKMAMDEWHAREATCDQFGLPVVSPAIGASDDPKGRILVVEPESYTSAKIAHTLEAHGHEIVTVPNGTAAEAKLTGSGPVDLVISALYLGDSDGLRLCSLLRSQPQTRRLPVLLVLGQDELGGLVKGFDLGVNDYLFRPIDTNELKARVRTQIRRKRYQDGLLDSYERSLALALTDGLTGLYNRRYFEAHFEAAVMRSRNSGKGVSILMIDLDHFKHVNDTHGHAVGDLVLKAVAQRISQSVREFDLAARIGGEEFVVVMPDSSDEVGMKVADRLRATVAMQPVCVSSEIGDLPVTVSIGVAAVAPGESGAAALGRADEALYLAKKMGRNRVAPARAAGGATSGVARSAAAG
ncbi:MAG TPA: PleD family two-component system response regulator [Alphaproteobacteria bacterium]|nr:PleD family two-component system response regulator [Alphaproteobacteria bacterium]